MTQSESDAAHLPAKHTILYFLLGLLGLACLAILRPVLAPLLWAAILAYVTWPAYRRLAAMLGQLRTTAALLMTVLVCCALVVPLIWLLVLVQNELLLAYRLFTAAMASGANSLPPAVRNIPWLGERLQELLSHYAAAPSDLGQELLDWLRRWQHNGSGVLGTISQTLLGFTLTALTLFFFYRDSELLIVQSRRVLLRFIGSRLDPYLRAAGVMTRAVIYGFVVTAFAQGLAAGLGYQLVGLHAPALLGALTGILSVMPTFGTALVWVPAGIWLLLTGHVWQGIALFAWGVIFVHPIDNLLRPLLISTATHVPFLLIMFGALGGMAAFGFVGAFVGPVLLGVALTIWREWAATGTTESRNDA
jgi:predicted PurR-regulated permease PerM